MRGKRPFSLGPDGDDPAGPLDHYAYGNKVRGAGEWGGLQEAGDCLSAHGGGVIWLLARGVWAKHLTSALHTNSSWSNE